MKSQIIGRFSWMSSSRLFWNFRIEVYICKWAF